MGAWHTRGLRGSVLEDCINFTNEYYRQHGIAVIQKIPTPITPVEMNKETSTITLAYFDKQSTVDYIGAVQGIPICFDAKEAAQRRLPLQNIHEHQIVFMEDFERQGGVAFLIIHFTAEDKYFYLRFEKLVTFWNRSKTRHIKSFKMDELEPEFEIRKAGVCLHYLEAIQKDLAMRP